MHHLRTQSTNPSNFSCPSEEIIKRNKYMRNLRSFGNFFIFFIFLNVFWCFCDALEDFSDDNCRKLFLLASQKFLCILWNAVKICRKFTTNLWRSNKSNWNQQSARKTMKPSQSPTEFLGFLLPSLQFVLQKKNCGIAPTIAAVNWPVVDGSYKGLMLS